MNRWLLGLVGVLCFCVGCGESPPPPKPAPTSGGGKSAPASSTTAAGGKKKADPAPTPDAPKEDAPKADAAPAKDAPAKDEPAKDAPAKDEPAKDEPAKKDGEKPGEEPAPTEKPLSALQQAVQVAQGGEFPKAIEMLKAAREADKKNRELVIGLAQFTQIQAAQLLQGGEADKANPLFLESAQHARLLRDEFGPIKGNEGRLVAMALYNGACVEAKSGKADDAVKTLGEAIDSGFDDLNQLDGDDDFAAIREQDGYKKVRAEAETKIAAAAKKAIAEELKNFESFEFAFELKDLEGKTVKLSDFKDKVVIVDIWGTWCPPCRMEIPHFVALDKKYREKGLQIVGINFERGEPDAVNKLIKEFAKEHGIEYKLVLGEESLLEKVPNFEGFPTTIFIDRTGKVRLKEVGYRPMQTLESVVTALLGE